MTFRVMETPIAPVLRAALGRSAEALAAGIINRVAPEGRHLEVA
jgi:hypothetical protein